MNNFEQNFNGISWNSSDLMESAWAFDILVKRGASLEELELLEFGNLDIEARYIELMGE